MSDSSCVAYLSKLAAHMFFAFLLIQLAGCNDDNPPGPSPDEIMDFCPADPDKTEEGLCGCGVPDTDTDNDGTPDCQDACPEDPGTIPDEFGFCGDTGDAAMVVEGEALTLAVNGAVLLIPADALAPDTAVTLTQIDPTLLDEPPNGPNENRVTPIYALEFGEVQLAGERIRFALAVPAATGNSTYTRIQITGGLATEGKADIDWRPLLGDFDAGQSLLQIELGATATRFLITGLTRASAAPADGAANAAGNAPQTQPFMKARALSISAATLAGESAWAEYGWVVLCDPEGFEDLDDARCDPLAPGFVPMMNQIGRSLYESDQQLTNLGFPAGILALINSARLAASDDDEEMYPHLFYDPDGRSGATAGGAGPVFYWNAWAQPDKSTPDVEDVLGFYDSATESVSVRVDLSPRLNNETAIHELMHSVQRLEIADVWSENWILEGLASAVEPNAPAYSGPTGKEYRYGDWRDWKDFLTSEEANNEYRVLEFWLSLTGDMSSIPRFFEWIRGIDSSIESNGQLRVDQALTSTGLPSLAEAYTDLILTRNDQDDYPHCDGEFMDDDGITFGFFCSESSCRKPVEDVQPFSAHCSVLEVYFESCGIDQPTDITVTLEPTSTNLNMKLILGGTVYDANTPVDFPNDGGRYWVINTDLESAIMSPGPTAELVFEHETPCEEYVVMTLQRLGTLVIASAGQSVSALSGAVQQELTEDYTSNEEQPEQSVLYTRSLDTSNPPIIITETSVPAIGFEPYTNTSVAFGEWLQTVPPGSDTTPEYRTASASASVESDTDSDGITLTTSGSIGADATSSDPSSLPMRSIGYALAVYNYKTLDFPAELTMTWPCTFTVVALKFDGETIFRWNRDPTLGGGPEDVFCGTETWFVPAGTEVEIDFVTHYIAANTEYGPEIQPPFDFPRNTGGSYEIRIEAIVPDPEE